MAFNGSGSPPDPFATAVNPPAAVIRNPENSSEPSGLYLHFPFCRRRCHYCHFTTLPFNPEPVSSYLDLLVREISLRSTPETHLDTLYLGGGSPSLLQTSQLERIMTEIRQKFQLLSEIEVTIEANPEDLSLQQMKEMVHIGFNRISIGVQSLDFADLKYLGRNHSPETALDALVTAEKAGFSRINADLIIGLPTQTVKGLEQQISRFLDLPVSHISVYLLEITENDTRSREHEGDRMYHAVRNLLNQSGFTHYEISNFSMPGEECRHNLKYWRNQSYLAAGISAAGYQQGVDYRNTPHLERYKKAVSSGRTSASKRRFPRDIRRLVTGLRLTEGVPCEAFAGRSEVLASLLESGILFQKRENISVAPKKLLLLNEILARYLL